MNLKNILVGVIVIGVIVFIILLLTKNSSSNEKNVNIYFFNAGKADATLIYNDSFSVLIDAGEKELGPTIVNYLTNHSIGKLDYLIITHFDKDHVGGASTVIDNIEVNTVITSNYKKDSEEYNNFVRSINNKKIIPIITKSDYKFHYGKASFIINFPNQNNYANKESNNSSLIISMTYGDKKFLFMGDAMELRIKEYLGLDTSKYDLIKIPYHGKKLDVTDEYISTYKPKYGIITSSTKEKDDNKKTTKVLDKYGVKYYFTYNGDILVTSNGIDIKVKQ